MKRRLEPEWLDTLPPEAPAAIASRRDLARINAVMLQPAIMARALRDFPPPAQLLDLGGGDGRFLLAVARRLPHWRGVNAIILDRQNILATDTVAAFAALGWRCAVRQADVLDGIADAAPGALVTANLFLHHLDDTALSQLFARIAANGAGLAACEPRRGAFALAASHLVALLGANAVTRHDAVASVRAGFAGQDLSALWPPGWRLHERGAFPFSHLFTARRDDV